MAKICQGWRNTHHVKAEEWKKDIRGEFSDNTNLTEDTCQNTVVVHRNTYKFAHIFNEIHYVVKVLECPSIAGHAARGAKK